jgi:hypothetical protein
MTDAMRTRRQLLGGGLAFLGAAAVSRTALAAPSAPDLVQIARSELQRAGSSVRNTDLVGVVDFSNPSRAARFHLVDMASGKIDSLLVAHGRGSDPAHSGWVRAFSNTVGSNCSSEGAYLTGGYYVGQHGRSMNLKGLEPSNSNAEVRRIVVHSAPYVSAEQARQRGVLGRSEGCFAVAASDLDKVLTRLGPGRLLVARKLAA